MPPNDEQVPQDDRLLDDRLLKAHALDDLGALVWLYLEAANSAIDDEAAQALLQAQVLALEGATRRYQFPFRHAFFRSTNF